MQEMELFKEAKKNPKYVSGEDIVRMLFKVWSAYTKFVRGLLQSGKSAVTIEFGKFIPTAQEACFIPSSSFLALGPYSYTPSFAHIQAPEQYLSYSSVSMASGYSKQQCMKSIKEIMHTIVRMALNGEVKLDFKVGILYINARSIRFVSSFKMMNHGDKRLLTPEAKDQANPANPNNIGFTSVTSKRVRTVPPAPENIPWPYLSAFYDDSAKKFSKKINVEEALSPMQLLEEHKRQIKEKTKKKELSNIEELHDGRLLAKVANSDLRNEREQRKNHHKQIQKTFVSGIKDQLVEHKQVSEKNRKEKLDEKYDFFPFTYGSKLEEFQSTLKAQRKDEMLDKLSADKQNFSKNYNLPESYLTSFPLFMKQDKAYPSRRLENTHIKAVMGQALNRYEQELQTIKQSKNQQELVEDQQKEMDKIYEDQNKETHIKTVKDHQYYLLQQIEENKKKKDQEKVLKAIPIKTHMGPEESPERILQEKTKIIAGKVQMKNDLVQQMTEKHIEFVDKKTREMKKEEENALAMVRGWEEGEIKMDIKNKAMKNLNREAWLRQMEIHKLEKKVNT